MKLSFVPQTFFLDQDQDQDGDQDLDQGVTFKFITKKLCCIY